MRSSNRTGRIFFIQRIYPVLFNVELIFGAQKRLTAAADASAAAVHDFNELIFTSAAAYTFQYINGIADFIDDNGLYCGAADIGCQFLYLTHAVQISAGRILKFISRCHMVCRSQSGLHNTAGISEDGPGPGSCAHETVKGAIGIKVFKFHIFFN